MIKIKNESKIPYKIIGGVIDDMEKIPITVYEGKVDYVDFTYKDKIYTIMVEYSSKYTTFTVLKP